MAPPREQRETSVMSALTALSDSENDDLPEDGEAPASKAAATRKSGRQTAAATKQQPKNAGKSGEYAV